MNLLRYNNYNLYVVRNYEKKIEKRGKNISYNVFYISSNNNSIFIYK